MSLQEDKHVKAHTQGENHSVTEEETEALELQGKED